MKNYIWLMLVFVATLTACELMGGRGSEYYPDEVSGPPPESDFQIPASEWTRAACRELTLERGADSSLGASGSSDSTPVSIPSVELFESLEVVDDWTLDVQMKTNVEAQLRSLSFRFFEVVKTQTYKDYSGVETIALTANWSDVALKCRWLEDQTFRCSAENSQRLIPKAGQVFSLRSAEVLLVVESSQTYRLNFRDASTHKCSEPALLLSNRYLDKVSVPPLPFLRSSSPTPTPTPTPTPSPTEAP